jgi:chemotaxis protein methyltransferase CheR
VVDLPCPPAVFSLLGSLVESRFGLHYARQDAEVFCDRVRLRAVERGFDSLLDYYYYLRYDPAGVTELDLLAEHLVVSETYFFREAKALTALVDLHLRPVILRGQRPRVWCAAAATGEEPLSLAMLLDQHGLLDDVDIIATDLSERALESARRGAYRGRSFRAAPFPGQERWLLMNHDHGTVSPDLIARIQWRRVNLCDPMPYPSGPFDAILCRNVLIYFSDEIAAGVVRRLSERLTPTGVLLVGISESLLRFGTLLRCEERGGVFFYEKVNP